MQRSDTQASKSHQSVKNPVTRIREELGYTQELFAAVAGVSRVAVMHTEQGLIKKVPDRIYKALDNPPGLDDHYRFWIRDTRLKNYPYLEKYIPGFLENSCDTYGNWDWFRKSISRSKAGFCKLYCIHPQVLANFEKSWMERGGLTIGMRVVLEDCGVPLDTIKNMEFAISRRISRD